MQQRLQTVGDDTVLELTENKPLKIRLSEKSLLREKAHLERNIDKLSGQLDGVNAKLALIANAKEDEKRRK